MCSDRFSVKKYRYEGSYRVFIKYCVFTKISKYFPDSGISRFFLVVYTGLHACVDHEMAGRTPVLQQNWQT